MQHKSIMHPIEIDAVIEGLEKGDEEITCGFSTQASQANKAEREALFNTLNAAAHR